MPTLLAVDTGLNIGLALYDAGGRLCKYRSQHFGDLAALRRAARRVLDEGPDVVCVVLEGGGPPADAWEREAARRNTAVRRVSAEQWRRQLLYPREHTTGRRAKRSAADLARQVISWSGARRPTALRHHAAEAILIGLWGVLEIGWLNRLPTELRH